MRPPSKPATTARPFNGRKVEERRISLCEHRDALPRDCLCRSRRRLFPPCEHQRVMRCGHLHIAKVFLASSGQMEYPMNLSIIPVAAVLVVPMVAPSANAASPQNTPVQLTPCAAAQA